MPMHCESRCHLTENGKEHKEGFAAERVLNQVTWLNGDGIVPNIV